MTQENDTFPKEGHKSDNAAAQNDVNTTSANISANQTISVTSEQTMSDENGEYHKSSQTKKISRKRKKKQDHSGQNPQNVQHTGAENQHSGQSKSNQQNHNQQNHSNGCNNNEPFIAENAQTYHSSEFKNTKIEILMSFASSIGVSKPETMRKQELIFAILQVLANQGHKLMGSGTLEIMKDGRGFLRSHQVNYVSGADDVRITHQQISKYKLRVGDLIEGQIKAPAKGEKHFLMHTIDSINENNAANNKMRAHFEDLTPIFPDMQICLENTDKPKAISSRLIDIVAPLGQGQRALLVAPPRTGKTVLMQNIAHSITKNYPDKKLIVLLIGERPEEVTDMSRSVKGEVVSSTFDEPSQRHVQLAEMTIERAKRLVENGENVVILLDSITRLARAYNDTAPSSGKILSGGVDSNALQKPKKFFGAARNIENGGSLTIIATALTETGSRMDEVIFEEFKGTGNAEIVLDRRIADKRIFPAIDISRSGTRKEDLLLEKEKLAKIWILRRITNNMPAHESIEFFIEKLTSSASNAAFFDHMDSLSGGKKYRD